MAVLSLMPISGMALREEALPADSGPRPEVFSLYVHIPFCRCKCTYCDFYSVPTVGDPTARFLNALAVELRLRAPQAVGGRVHTIFLGGGTPSVLGGAGLARVLALCQEHFLLTPDAEITFEANPESATAETLQQARAAGYNRISIGVQSFHPPTLKALQRIHSPEQAEGAVHHATDAGFTNVSVDLMYGCPHETERTWRDTVARALDLPLTHLSAYALTVEESTPLAPLVASGSVVLPDEDAVADRYTWLVDAAARAGFEHYEISNYARPGHACRHNLHYWQRGWYLGFGPGAHSHWAGVRYCNPRDLRGYYEVAEGETVSRWPCGDVDLITPEVAAREAVFLGLRTREGVRLDEVPTRESGWIRRMAEQCAAARAAGLMEQVRGAWRFTESGWLVSDAVMADLF